MPQRQKEIVQATVPVLQQYGEAIATAFYTTLFEEHPSLFNTKEWAEGCGWLVAPESISIGENLRMTEPGDSVVDFNTQPCPLAGACLLKGALDSAYAAFLDKLDEYSLAEVARTPRLQKLVHLKT